MISLADLIARFGEEELAERTDRENYRQINEEVVARAIEDAEHEINAYLAPVGLVGIEPPKALKLKACDIARYYLYDDGVTPIIEARYKQAIAWLKEVMKNPKMLSADARLSDEVLEIKSAIAVHPNPTPSIWEE